MTGKNFAKISTTISNGVGREGGRGGGGWLLAVLYCKKCLQQRPGTGKGARNAMLIVQFGKKSKEIRIQGFVNGRNREKGREMKQYILVHIPRENREIKAVLWIRSDPKLIEISGSRKNNNFGSRQLRSRMNLSQFFNKNAQFKNKIAFLSQKMSLQSLSTYKKGKGLKKELVKKEEIMSR
jgi:hypothetical protein